MEAYYCQKNTARIGATLIAAVRTLMDRLCSAHGGNYKDDEKAQIQALHQDLNRLKKQDAELRIEAERIATEVGKLTWKITRSTRPKTQVRRELAGLSKRITELLS